MENRKVSTTARKWAAVIAFGIAASFIISQAPCVTYTGSISYATGEYIFAERTHTLSISNGISFTISPFDFSISVPLIYQNSPWISFNGYGIIPSGGPQHSDWQEMKRAGASKVPLMDTTRYNQFGIADPNVHAAIALVQERKIFPSFSLTADVKPPVASTSHGFGTGAWDYALGVSLSKKIGDTFFFADISYWILGDMPDLVLHNPISYGFSLGYPFDSGKYSIIASFSGSTRVLDVLDPPMQLDAALSHRLSNRVSLLADVSFGLTESSPDFGASIGWSVIL